MTGNGHHHSLECTGISQVNIVKLLGLLDMTGIDHLEGVSQLQVEVNLVIGMVIVEILIRIDKITKENRMHLITKRILETNLDLEKKGWRKWRIVLVY
jgi:hypothetical protein